MKKTTLYIDIDDDIAAIIEKLEAADQKIVAMVLPKRPSALQSSVNLNLLKATSDETGKNLVLITNDEQVSRLAGQAGVYVSASLQSKPAIPSVAQQNDDTIVVSADSSDPASSMDPAQPDVYAEDKKLDLKTPVGELAATDSDEIELDNSDVTDEQAKAADDTAQKKVKPKIKVPNFGIFRTKLIAGGVGLVVLIGVLYWATAIAPTAAIVIKTEKSEVEVKTTLTAGKSIAAVDVAKAAFPAIRKEDKQKLSGSFTATGQKDVGEKASGTVTFRNCEDTDPITIPSGTGVSKGGLTFITQKSVTLEGGDFSGGGSVCDSTASEAVKVVASQSGDKFNIAAGSYQLAGGFGNIPVSGSAMGGGTSKIAKVVTQEDIDIAKTVVLAKGADNVKGKLAKLLKDDGLIAIEDTFLNAEGAPVSSVAVGQEATTDPTLTIEVTSSMLGVKQSDLEPLVRAEVTKKIDVAKQKIYSTGLSNPKIAVTEKKSADEVKLVITSSASVGPNLDQAKVITDISGKKAGEAKQLLEQIPGVASVDIDLGPFWVFSIPKKADKISLTINE